MDTTTENTEAITTDEPTGYAGYAGHAGPAPERVLRRTFDDRMLAGVASGVARYLNVDVLIVRIAFVVLAVAGGAGIPLYLAGLLLIPEEGSNQSIAGSLIESLQSR